MNVWRSLHEMSVWKQTHNTEKIEVTNSRIIRFAAFATDTNITAGWVGLQNVDHGWRHRDANHPQPMRASKTTPVQSATRGFGKPPFLPNSAAAIFHAFNANEMSRDVTRYRLVDAVGVLSSGFVSSQFVAYRRFLAVGLLAVVVLLHKVPIAFVPGASRTPALRTSQRVHAVWVPRSDAASIRRSARVFSDHPPNPSRSRLVRIINSPSIQN